MKHRFAMPIRQRRPQAQLFIYFKYTDNDRLALSADQSPQSAPQRRPSGSPPPRGPLVDFPFWERGLPPGGWGAPSGKAPGGGAPSLLPLRPSLRLSSAAARTPNSPSGKGASGRSGRREAKWGACGAPQRRPSGSAPPRARGLPFLGEGLKENTPGGEPSAPYQAFSPEGPSRAEDQEDLSKGPPGGAIR